MLIIHSHTSAWNTFLSGDKKSIATRFVNSPERWIKTRRRVSTEFAKSIKLVILVHFQTPDFVEATIYNKEEAVIMVGHFANVCNAEQESRINHVSLWYKPWFYKHVESFLLKGPSEEYIPLRE